MKVDHPWMEWKNTSFSNHFITFFCCSGCVDDDGWLGERKRGSVEKIAEEFFFFWPAPLSCRRRSYAVIATTWLFFHRSDTSGFQANRQLLKRTWCVITPYAKWHQFIQSLECQNWISKVHVWQLVNALRSALVWRHGAITQPHANICDSHFFYFCNLQYPSLHLPFSPPSNFGLVWLVRQEQ